MKAASERPPALASLLHESPFTTLYVLVHLALEAGGDALEPEPEDGAVPTFAEPPLPP